MLQRQPLHPSAMLGRSRGLLSDNLSPPPHSHGPCHRFVSGSEVQNDQQSSWCCWASHPALVVQHRMHHLAFLPLTPALFLLQASAPTGSRSEAVVVGPGGASGGERQDQPVLSLTQLGQCPDVGEVCHPVLGLGPRSGGQRAESLPDGAVPFPTPRVPACFTAGAAGAAFSPQGPILLL